MSSGLKGSSRLALTSTRRPAKAPRPVAARRSRQCRAARASSSLLPPTSSCSSCGQAGKQAGKKAGKQQQEEGGGPGLKVRVMHAHAPGVSGGRQTASSISAKVAAGARTAAPAPRTSATSLPASCEASTQLVPTSQPPSAITARHFWLRRGACDTTCVTSGRQSCCWLPVMHVTCASPQGAPPAVMGP